jgi:hypothetical protein
MFPAQKVPVSKKTEQWRKDCVNYIIGAGEITQSGGGRTRYEDMQTYYDLYNSIYNEKDLKYVTNPYKQDDGFPATAQNYNIIRPKIDLLIGEETKRPFNFIVTRTSEDAVSELQERGKNMLIDYMYGQIMSNMSPEDAELFQQQLQSGEIQTPEQIQKYMTKDYKDIAEMTAYHTLNYLRKKLNIDHEFMKAWKDGLIAGEEVMYVGIHNQNPYLRRVNPMYFAYEQSPDLEFIDDATWCVERMKMGYTEVYDMLYDKMSETQLNKLLDQVDGRTGKNTGVDKNSGDDFNHIKLHITSGNLKNMEYNDADIVDVYHVCWKSFKKIGFVTILNPETGQEESFEVDEYYVETGMEIKIDWEWVIQVWEGWRVGAETDDLYVGIAPLEYQHISADNPNSQKLPYTGVVYSNTNSSSKSLVALMKNLQYFYIILWYRLELAMARDKGKILTIDITQIPKSMDMDVPRWLHMLNAVGINFINPYEEGWDIPGREGGKPAAYNQMTEHDLTMGNVISQYIELMFKIEDMIAEISGVTKQRQGAIASNELVGNVERSVVQSAHITEPLFWMHNQVKKRALTMLLDTAKDVWSNSNKQCLHYILDDGTRAFLNITDKFLYEDFDIFVSDSTEELNRLQQLQSLYQPAMQNGASLLDIAEIMTMDNLSMIKDRLVEIDARTQQRIQESQERELQNQQMVEQIRAEAENQKLELAYTELELNRYKVDQDNATKIAVAEIGAFRFQEDLDQNNDGVLDPMQAGELAVKRQDSAIKSFETQEKLHLQNKDIDAKQSIENKRIALEEKKLEAALKLQKTKDDAAMKREELKAKTALKNKVSGESKKSK